MFKTIHLMDYKEFLALILNDNINQLIVLQTCSPTIDPYQFRSSSLDESES